MRAPVDQVPRHVAIIMDGNGRWAKARGKPRAAGHKAGVAALREVVKHGVRRGLDILTVYAFSSENWRRPGDEVSLLMELFVTALKDEVGELRENNVKLSFIGDLSGFPRPLRTSIEWAQRATADNDGLRLVVAANYGGRWEIASACRELLADALRAGGGPEQVSEEALARRLSLPQCPDPDLFIRTGGELRISNFLLWQLAYTELYFTEVYWPDFDNDEFDKALQWYVGRQRRFGRTSEQVARSENAG